MAVLPTGGAEADQTSHWPAVERGESRPREACPWREPREDASCPTHMGGLPSAVPCTALPLEPSPSLVHERQGAYQSDMPLTGTAILETAPEFRP